MPKFDVEFPARGSKEVLEPLAMALALSERLDAARSLVNEAIVIMDEAATGYSEWLGEDEEPQSEG